MTNWCRYKKKVIIEDSNKFSSNQFFNRDMVSFWNKELDISSGTCDQISTSKWSRTCFNLQIRLPTSKKENVTVFFTFAFSYLKHLLILIKRWKDKNKYIFLHFNLFFIFTEYLIFKIFFIISVLMKAELRAKLYTEKNVYRKWDLFHIIFCVRLTFNYLFEFA